MSQTAPSSQTAPPGTTLNTDANGNITGYTFNNVYTGGNYGNSGTTSAGDFTGYGPTQVFDNDITLNSSGTTNGIDSRLIGTDGTGLIFRPSFQYSTGYFKGPALTVNDDDGVLTSSSGSDSTGQTTASAFTLTHGGVSGANVRTLPAGSSIVVRGEIEFTLINPSTGKAVLDNGQPVTVTSYLLATPKSGGGYNNFGMATDQSLEALVKKYGLSQIQLKVTGTKPPSDLPICFSADALIDTDHGPVRAGDLKIGDMVRTRDAGLQPIRWIGSNTIPMLPLTEKSTRPIRIAAGALGDGMPNADLVVSPQHRVLVRSQIAQKMFGTDEVLVAAKQLLQHDGVDVATDLPSVTYVHFLFDDHQIVFSNGAQTESLYTGAQALKTVGDAALQEIFTIFPELADGTERPAARLLASGRMARKLAVRHAQNSKPLVN